MDQNNPQEIHQGMVTLYLARIDFLKTGIFGKLRDQRFHLSLFTLEHAYPYSQTSIGSDTYIYRPIIPEGEYLCRRGYHSLKNGSPFETFEVLGIHGHTGLLFHAGNFNKDSEGCILLGLNVIADEMVTNSRAAFTKFMDFLSETNVFKLKVEG